jgi:hypothetical protein
MQKNFKGESVRIYMINIKCLDCGKEYKDTKWKYVKRQGVKRRKNYRFGKKSKSRISVTCPCGGACVSC